MTQSTLDKYKEYFNKLKREDLASKKTKKGNVNQAEEEAKRVLRKIQDIITRK